MRVESRKLRGEWRGVTDLSGGIEMGVWRYVVVLATQENCR